MPGEISLNSLVEILALENLPDLWLCTHSHMDLVSGDKSVGFFFPSCAHTGLYRKSHGKTSLPVTWCSWCFLWPIQIPDHSFLCVLVLAEIELMFFRGALTGLSRVCAENTIGSARIFLLLLSSTYTKEPRPFLFLIPPCQETVVVQGDLAGTAGCKDLRDIPYHMILCSAMWKSGEGRGHTPLEWWPLSS